MTKTEIQMFPSLIKQQFRWVQFRGYWCGGESAGCGLRLPSDLRLADSNSGTDEKMGLHHPNVAYSENHRVWYSPTKNLYLFISYNPQTMDWYATPSKSKSAKIAIAELEQMKVEEAEFEQHTPSRRTASSLNRSIAKDCS